MAKEYDFKDIETKWKKIWDEAHYGYAPDDSDKPKHYHLVEFPYPSGYGLHVGHCMGYGASDAYCRMKRMQGFNVMYPMGWDAFGLPTENFAIKNKVKPQAVTKQAVATFKDQMKSLGYAFDWDREINTTDPDYYRWTQWIFLQFYKHAIVAGKLIKLADDDTTAPRLSFQAEMPVNWCPSCRIILANEEVVGGNCERCGSGTEKRKQKQWMLRITAYADRLIKDLETVDYLEKIKTQQINWIGKSTGSLVKFQILNSKSETNTKLETQNSKQFVEVFTTRADTLFGCTYVVLSPEHPLVDNFKSQITNVKEVEEYIDLAKKKSDIERTELAKDKTGVELKGVQAINPINGEKVSVWIADYVLGSYGTGAVMAVPAHDERDWEFAKKYGVQIKRVVIPVHSADSGLTPAGIESTDIVFTDYGILTNSGEFNGLTSKEAKQNITEKLKADGAGDFTTNFKLRDWIFSRQHYWGEPIPIVHCEKCGKVPVPEDQLPITLPEVENYQPTDTGESPLAKITDWVDTTCPKCGGKAKRETDTMPNWAGSSWYYLAYAMNHESGIMNQGANKNIFSTNQDELNYWLPVDIYNGGMEHTTLHLLYSRFWNKFLYDLKISPVSEPYAKRIAHGIILGPDGQKMSKSKGNVINPDDIVRQYGADTLRAYIMFIGPYDQESAWNTAGVQGVHRFLNRVWKSQHLVSTKEDSKELLIKLNQTITGVTSDLENFRMNTVISKLMELNNAIEKEGYISKDSYAKFLVLLYPAVPFISSELWETAGFDAQIQDQSWPIADEKFLTAEKIEVVIQINGKVKGKLVVDSDIQDEKLKELALSSDQVKVASEGKEIVKVIVVPKKLVSIVVK